jgi:hypothetical protein
MAGNPTDAALDGLRVRVRYDGSTDNAIDVPVSQFFGAGHERALYKSLPLGTDSPQGYYCYWPMPYRAGAVVELYNSTTADITIDSAAVEHKAGAVSPQAGYLYAVYNESQGGTYHTLLNVEGRGHYVGNLLSAQNTGISRDFLEGDDSITVDGSLVLRGTGLEDAYNGGYYYNHVLKTTTDYDVENPENGILAYSGLLHMDDSFHGDAFVRTDQYRWLIGDSIPFTSGLEVLVENTGGTSTRFASTAFYYLTPEPATLALMGTGAAAVLALRRRRSGTAPRPLRKSRLPRPPRPIQ